MYSGHHLVPPYSGEGPGSQVVQPPMEKLRHKEGKEIPKATGFMDGLSIVPRLCPALPAHARGSGGAGRLCPLSSKPVHWCSPSYTQEKGTSSQL